MSSRRWLAGPLHGTYPQRLTGILHGLRRIGYRSDHGQDNHIFRRADRSKYEDEQSQLTLHIKQIFDDSEQRYGAEKIRVTLAESAIHTSKKRIAAIMQELGLHSIRVDAKKVFKRNQQYKKQNLLKREFSASRPNEIWVSDITYFTSL